jgi:translocator protein
MSYIPSLTLPSLVFETPAASILLPISLGMGTGLAVHPKSTQKTYLALKQPPYRPPPQIFGPIWTTMYGLMGYAAYRAWDTGMSSLDPAKVENTRRGATLYSIQLALNLIWMPLFFKLERPIEAAVDIVTLTGTVGYLTYIWNKVDPIASYCMMPYLGWMCFATYLNIGVGHLNGWKLPDKEKPQSEKEGETKYVNEDPKQQ